MMDDDIKPRKLGAPEMMCAMFNGVVHGGSYHRLWPAVPSIRWAAHGTSVWNTIGNTFPVALVIRVGMMIWHVLPCGEHRARISVTPWVVVSVNSDGTNTGALISNTNLTDAQRTDMGETDACAIMQRWLQPWLW